MREICTSGSTRGEWVALSASPSLLLYRLGIGDPQLQPLAEPRPEEAVWCDHFTYSSEALVGPPWPVTRFNTLGPEALNSFSGSSFESIRKPMKQFCISSQFCKPHTISLVGSGLNRLLAELS